MIRIDKHIQLIKFPGFEYPHCNTLWIEDDVNCLIDTSPGQDDLQYLLAQQVDLVVNTHGHIDHYLYNHLFPNAKIMMHQGDSEQVNSSQKYLEIFGFGKYLPDPAVAEFYINAVQYRTTRINEYLEEGKTISLGSTRFETLHLPGHSPGHCGFIFPANGFLYTSDIDLSVFGPWYANINCSIKLFLESISRVLSINPDYIITGHGEGIVKNDYRERLKVYRDIIFAREKRIVSLIHKGVNTLESITDEFPIYRILPKPEIIFKLYEKIMVLMHLEHLVDSGLLLKVGESYYLEEGVSPAQF